jgi:hypothetical protein
MLLQIAAGNIRQLTYIGPTPGTGGGVTGRAAMRLQMRLQRIRNLVGRGVPVLAQLPVGLQAGLMMIMQATPQMSGSPASMFAVCRLLCSGSFDGEH